MTAGEDFEIIYAGELVKVKSRKNYFLDFPDGRWLSLAKHPDDSYTIPTGNANISYSPQFVWVVEDRSAGPSWLSPQEVQAIGELIKSREQESGQEK